MPRNKNNKKTPNKTETCNTQDPDGNKTKTNRDSNSGQPHHANQPQNN